MSKQSDPIEAESLTEFALHGLDEPTKQLFDQDSLAEYEALTVFVAACREASSVESDDAALADRVLLEARSEDLSWRGDLRLVKGFVQDGLRSSTLLRLAAASVLVHLVALPVGAFFALSQERKVPEFRVEVGQRELPYSVHDDDGLQAPLAVELDASVVLDVLLVENTLKWSRWQLSMRQDPSSEQDSEMPDWLRQRAAILWGPASSGYAWEFDSVFLSAEAALDVVLVGSSQGYGRDVVPGFLGPLRDRVGSPSEPETWLALSSLARAESYGVLDEAGARVLHDARISMPVDHRFRALIEVEGDLRRRLPLDPLWVEAVLEFEHIDGSSAWMERLRKISELGDH